VIQLVIIFKLWPLYPQGNNGQYSTRIYTLHITDIMHCLEERRAIKAITCVVHYPTHRTQYSCDRCATLSFSLISTLSPLPSCIIHPLRTSKIVPALVVH